MTLDLKGLYSAKAGKPVPVEKPSLSFLMLLGISLFLAFASTAHAEDSELRQKIVTAFLEDPAVMQETERLLEEERQPGEIGMVYIGGGCGFAGCHTTYLVVRTFTTKGANPQTGSVSAMVGVDPRGEIGPVELAEIVPKDRDAEPLSKEYRPSPPLRVERKFPPPKPQLRIERDIP